MLAREEPLSLGRLLTEIAHEYLPQLISSQLVDVRRIAFELRLVAHRPAEPITVCDIGGGVGMFSVACTALGWRSILVDDLGDGVNRQYGDSALGPHRRHGVQVIQKDALEGELPIAPESLDVVTCFNVMEHFHRSPKKLFRSLAAMLKPGGSFILSVPNCVNLRKRITVPLGYGKWSSMGEWYEAEQFRSHVREPDVDDLRYIARDLGLTDVQILGRNWAADLSPSALIRALAKLSDRFLRLWPTLCADIYMLGTKPI
jgi:SAM-dependent methyltransferase